MHLKSALSHVLPSLAKNLNPEMSWHLSRAFYWTHLEERYSVPVLDVQILVECGVIFDFLLPLNLKRKWRVSTWLDWTGCLWWWLMRAKYS